MRSRPARILLSETPGPSAEAMKMRLIERGYLVGFSGSDETSEMLDSLRPDLAIVRTDPLKPSDATANIEEICGRLDVPAVFLGAPADLALIRPVKGLNFY